MAVWTSDKKIKFRKDHPVAMPLQQPRHNYAKCAVKAYFDTIFDADHTEYKGMVSVAARNLEDGQMRLIAVVPAEEMGSWASQMHVSTKMDYYYAKAQHSGKTTWSTEGVFAHNAIYVDIDAHDLCIDADAERHVVDLITAMLPGEGYPIPNIVERSGRGIHLIWLIDQVSAKIGWMVRSVSTDYANAVKKLLKDYDINGYQVDIGYASNIAGLTRMPGTYNTTSKSYATFDLIHRSRIDLTAAFDTAFDSQTRLKIVGYRSAGKVQQEGHHRVTALLCLSAVRPIQPGYRDKYLLHLFSAAQMAGMTNAAALDLVHSANASFAMPMCAREVERNLSTAGRKRYRYRTATIVADLDITDEEQQAIGLYTSTHRDSNSARRARNTKKRAVRDRNIMRLYMVGLSTTAIAAKVGHAYNTIRKVIQCYADRLSDLFSAAELQRIIRQRAKLIAARIRTAKVGQSLFGNVFQNMTSYILCLYTRIQVSGCNLVTCRGRWRKSAPRADISPLGLGDASSGIL